MVVILGLKVIIVLLFEWVPLSEVMLGVVLPRILEFKGLKIVMVGEGIIVVHVLRL